ncbi:MAG: hypothetical protein ACKOTB_17235, partial [Planctomycetia bacterium]
MSKASLAATGGTEAGMMFHSQARPHVGCLARAAVAAIVLGAIAIGIASAASAAPAEDPSVTPPVFGEASFEPTPVDFRELVNVEEPLWTDYALADALFWGRDNQAANLPLIVSSSTGVPLVSAADPQFAVAPGVRAFYGQRDPCLCGWEIGYFGVYGMTASRFAAATPPAFLEFPGAIGSVLTADGRNATIKYLST